MLKDILRLQVDIGLTFQEFGLSLMSRQCLDAISPKGNGDHPIITLPGFTATESSMLILNRFLNRNGYIAQSWGLGKNHGPQGQSYEAHVEQLTERLRHKIISLADRHGHGVSLVGQSLGGVDAREIGRRLEPYIDRVITLGAPTFDTKDMTPHNAILVHMGMRHGKSMENQFGGDVAEHWGAADPEIPCVAIYSPIDAAVNQSSTKIPDNIVSLSRAPAIRENLRIFCSHGGMALNPFVLLAIADRLTADVKNWLAFDYKQYSNLLTRLPMDTIYTKPIPESSRNSEKYNQR